MTDLDPSLIAELRRVVQKLALMSHTSAMSLSPEPADTSQDIGGKRPAGGIPAKDDREDAYRQKSAIYFQRKFNRTRTDTQLRELIAEAEQALEDWRKTPQVSRIEPPEEKSFDWKCQVAEDTLPMWKLEQKYGLSPATIYRYRLKYRGLRKRAA